MRKILLSCLMVSIMAMPALAGLNFPDIDVKGKLSLKSIMADDYEFNSNTPDKVDYVELYADLTFSAKLTDDVSVTTMLRNISKEGKSDNPNLDFVLSNTAVFHSYLTVKDIAGVDAVIGRQNIGEKKNSLVYQASNADAIKLSKKCGPVDVTYISANGPESYDDLSAIMLGTKIGPVDAALARYTELVSGASANAVLDLAVSGKIPVGCGINASLEYAVQSGRKVLTVEKDATAVLLKLGCDGCDMGVGKVSCGLTYLNASGDDAATADKNEDYSGVNPSLKLTEIVSDRASGKKTDDDAYNTAIANRNAIVLNLGLAPAAVAGLNLGLAYGTYKANEGTEKNLATELNLTAGYKVSDAVSLSLLLAQMDPDKGLTSYTDKATKIQAGMKIVF